MSFGLAEYVGAVRQLDAVGADHLAPQLRRELLLGLAAAQGPRGCGVSEGGLEYYRMLA